MIRNERQLRIAQQRRDAIRESAAQLDDADDRLMYEGLETEVQEEIDEYCGIRDGFVDTFLLADVGDLADALVKARLARGLSQRELGERLDVTEQMVQKDEAGGYERAGINRLAEVADVLGYQLRGHLTPIENDSATTQVDIQRAQEVAPLGATACFDFATSVSHLADSRKVTYTILREVKSTAFRTTSEPSNTDAELASPSSDDCLRFADNVVGVWTSGDWSVNDWPEAGWTLQPELWSQQALPPRPWRRAEERESL